MKKKDWLYPRSPGFSVIILTILYLVGTFGIPSDLLGPILLPLSPFQLLLSLIVLLFFQPVKNHRFWMVAFFVFLASIAIEIAGVASGAIFGSYQYGNSLGPKVIDVPIIIGVNWVLLVVGSAMISSRISSNWVIRAVIGASIMVALDLLIEPLSAYLDFWYWESGEIPMQNFLAWWLISFLFHLIFQKVYLTKVPHAIANPLALPIMTLQFAFFLIINLFAN